MPDPVVLVGDVGGTNLRLALMASGGEDPRLLRKATFSTQAEPSPVAAIQRFLSGCAQAGLQAPRVACLAGAGPVMGRRIALTNAPWDLDASALERGLDLPVHLLNDVSVLGYGLQARSPRNEEMLLPLTHGNGTQPFPVADGPMLLVGAGTGLGVGFATRSQGQFQVHPSEGGHLGLPVTDEVTMALWRYLAAEYPGPPGAEAAVSGQGIARTFRFLLDTGRFPVTPAAHQILALPEGQRPQAIAKGTDPACLEAMGLFVELYGRVCAELAAVLLPTGGIYLTGGIAAKNPAHFRDGGRFMASFERNYRDHLNALTEATPVYIVRDDDLGLYGAARYAMAQEDPPS